MHVGGLAEPKRSFWGREAKEQDVYEECGLRPARWGRKPPPIPRSWYLGHDLSASLFLQDPPLRAPSCSRHFPLTLSSSLSSLSRLLRPAGGDALTSAPYRARKVLQEREKGFRWDSLRRRRGAGGQSAFRRAPNCVPFPICSFQSALSEVQRGRRRLYRGVFLQLWRLPLSSDSGPCPLTLLSRWGERSVAILWWRRGRLLLRRPIPHPLLACLAVWQSVKSPASGQVRPWPRAIALPAALGGPGRSLPGLTTVTMSSFSESALEKKLSELSNSQQSVQTLSLWLIHHRKHAGPIVSVWHRELRKGKHLLPTFGGPPGAVLSPTHRWGPSSFFIHPCFPGPGLWLRFWGRRQCYPHFSEKETETRLGLRYLSEVPPTKAPMPRFPVHPAVFPSGSSWHL